jgi:ubiquinone/menaquinone biosynthesis C-methylase UbiE
MDHYINIYTLFADIYHRMIAAEDVDGNLLRAIEGVTTLLGKRILDLGSGTGRIPLLVYPQAAQITALDLHWGMLCEQQRQRDQRNGNWGLLQGDLRILPFPENRFDVITAGWAIGHFQGWFHANWHNQVDQAIREILRVLKPEGKVLIIETLTTGSTMPAPPTQGLADYYARLENQWGFSRQQIQTDFQFSNVEEAIKLSEFFFGAELAKKVRQNNWVRLPEWTGVWSLVNNPASY